MSDQAPGPDATCRSFLVEQLVAELRTRADHGLAKYGVTPDRADLTTAQWLQHAIEEQFDNLVYLKAAMLRVTREAQPEEINAQLAADNVRLRQFLRALVSRMTAKHASLRAASAPNVKAQYCAGVLAGLTELVLDELEVPLGHAEKETP